MIWKRSKSVVLARSVRERSFLAQLVLSHLESVSVSFHTRVSCL